MFSPTTKALKALGLVRPTTGMNYVCWTIWNYLVIFVGVEFIIITIYGTITEKSSIYLKLEYTAFISSTCSMAFRLLVITVKKKELFSLFERIQDLLERMEVENGTDSLPSLTSRCKKIAYVLVSSPIIVCGNAYIMAYVKHYVDGVEDSAPFEVALPFERKNNIHAVVWYEVVQFYSSVAVVAATSIVLATLAATTSELSRKVAECFERIDETNADNKLRQTIGWHSEVIMLTRETNALLSLTIFVDYLLSLQYISIGGFLLVRIGLTNTSSLSKYLGLYLGFLINPIFFCIGGHVVSGENERLYASIYHTKWYRLSPKTMKNLILPLMMAQKGLSWNFKGYLYFDMVLYLGLVRQSYSLIAFLKIVS